MKERLFRGDSLGRERSRREDFDPIAEGQRYGLAPDISAALWDHARREATNRDGLCDEELAHERFAQVARRIAERGAQLGPAPFKWTQVGIAASSAVPVGNVLAEPAPHKTTQVLARQSGHTRVGLNSDPGRTTLMVEHTDSNGCTPEESLEFFRVAVGAGRFQLAKLARGIAAIDHGAALVAGTLLRQELRSARWHFANGLAHDERLQQELAALEQPAEELLARAPTVSDAALNATRASNGSRDLWDREAADWRATIGRSNATEPPTGQAELVGPGASAIEPLNQLASRELHLGRCNAITVVDPQHAERPRLGFDHYRVIGLKELLQRLGPGHARQDTLAAATEADRSVAWRAKGWLESLPSVPVPTPNGQALFRAAERHAATLFRRAVSRGLVDATDPAVESALQQRGTGELLPAELSRAMERELGVELAGVRIHTDAVAAEAARALGAEAFAVGEDIFFAAGMFSPDTRSGRQLLAHELTHVAQALRGHVRAAGEGLQVSQPGEPLEQEADAFAQRVGAVAIPPAPAQGKDHAPGAAASVPRASLPALALLAPAKPAPAKLATPAQPVMDPALLGETRQTLVALLKSIDSELQRTIGFLPQLKAEFESVTWIIPWQPYPPAWPQPPMDFIRDQVSWMVRALSSGRALLGLSSQTEHDVSIALLRQAGIRVSSVMLGFSELRPFLYYLQAAIGLRYGGPLLDPVLLARPVEDARAKIAPDLAAFARLEAGSLQAVAASASATTQALFGEIPNYVKRFSPMTLPKLPWQAEALLLLVSALLEIPGGAVMGEEGGFTLVIRGGMMPSLAGGGAAAVSAITLTAEQIAALRRLIAIGALSTAVVSAAFGTSLAVGVELPPALTDLIGEGPEASAMHEAGKTGAGMARSPRHHVLPQEERTWFEERGMKGDLDIDEFTVEMDEAEHKALHGGGNWRLGRKWPGEWNQHIMKTLREAEEALGRKLRPNDILDVVAQEMRRYDVPMDFVPYRAP